MRRPLNLIKDVRPHFSGVTAQPGDDKTSKAVRVDMHAQYRKEEIMVVRVVDIAATLETFQGYWSPKIVGEVNNFQVKLVKLHGPFEWHHHEVEDELFLVIKGVLTMKMRDGDLAIEPGQFVIIPHGVEHQPVAEDEVHVLLLEPSTTLNTGTETNARTVAVPERL